MDYKLKALGVKVQPPAKQLAATSLFHCCADAVERKL